MAAPDTDIRDYRVVYGTEPVVFGAPKWIELYRLKLPGYPRGDRQNGAFQTADGLRIIISNGEGWEHVSVSRKSRVPDYADMCRMKEAFWSDNACVMQLHVPKENHINCHEYCLHLWRPTAEQIPQPPSILVGI